MHVFITSLASHNKKTFQKNREITPSIAQHLIADGEQSRRAMSPSLEDRDTHLTPFLQNDHELYVVIIRVAGKEASLAKTLRDDLTKKGFTNNTKSSHLCSKGIYQFI